MRPGALPAEKMPPEPLHRGHFGGGSGGNDQDLVGTAVVRGQGPEKSFECDGEDLTRQPLHRGIVQKKILGIPPQKVNFTIQIISLIS